MSLVPRVALGAALLLPTVPARAAAPEAACAALNGAIQKYHYLADRANVSLPRWAVPPAAPR